MTQRDDSGLRGTLQNGSTSPRLVLEEPTGRREVRLDSGAVWKLGRSSSSTVTLHDETISRNHAMIQHAETGEYYFIDLGSQNGSFVNDRRVSTPVALKNGDRISLGRISIVFRNPNEPSGNRPASLSDFSSTRQVFAQRLVTVLVVDIRDYTVLANTIDQAALCQLIGNWFSQAECIMQRHGSSVQKYIGDAVMAVWVHQAIGQEREDAVRMLRALLEFEEATTLLTQRFGISRTLRIGAGLNTGTAALGSAGPGDITALGDSVNMAFRLEKATKDLKTDIVLGQTTFDCLRHLPAATEYFRAEELALKGYVTPAKARAISFSQLKTFLGSLDDRRA